MKPITIDGRRFYPFEDGPLPSVTTITDGTTDAEWLAKLYARAERDHCFEVARTLATNGTRYSFLGFAEAWTEARGRGYEQVRRTKVAQDRGTLVHALIAHHLDPKHDKASLKLRAIMANPDAIPGAFVSWLDWYEDSGFKVARVEHTVKGDGYAGTIDAIGSLFGHVIVDWKTGVQRSSDVLQLSAYHQAWSDTDVGDEAIDGLLLYLDRDGGKAVERWFKFTELEDAYCDGFRPLLSAFNWMREFEQTKKAKREAVTA